MNVPDNSKIFLAYPSGAFREALVSRLLSQGHDNLVVADTLDLREKEAVLAFFERELPDYVFFMSAQARSLDADSFQPPQWLRDNLLSVTNMVDAAYLYDVGKLLCLDCSATLLEDAALPLQRQHWPPARLEEARYACAVTRRATTELCDSYRRQYNCNFVSAVSSSVYGPGVRSEPGCALVPTLLEEMQRATETNLPVFQVLGHPYERHSLLHLDDLTGATLFMMDQVARPGQISVGLTQSCTLSELVNLVASVTGYRGTFEFGPRLPFQAAPTPELPLERLGWRTGVSLLEGVYNTARWHIEHQYPAHF